MHETLELPSIAGKAARGRKRSTANGVVRQWLKKAVLLSFPPERQRCTMGAHFGEAMGGCGPPRPARGGTRSPTSSTGWDASPSSTAAGFRAVPGAVAFVGEPSSRSQRRC